MSDAPAMRCRCPVCHRPFPESCDQRRLEPVRRRIRWLRQRELETPDSQWLVEERRALEWVVQVLEATAVAQ